MKTLTDFRKTVEAGVDPHLCVMFRDKWLIRFFKFPFCGDFSLHLHKMVTRAENFQRHVSETR